MRDLAGVGGFRLGLKCPDEAARRMGFARPGFELFLAPLLPTAIVAPSKASSHETSLLLLPNLSVAVPASPFCEGFEGFGVVDEGFAFGFSGDVTAVLSAEGLGWDSWLL